MKIIAKMQDEKYLAEVTIEEIANLVGANSYYDTDFREYFPRDSAIVGSEIKIKDQFDKCRFLDNLEADATQAITLMYRMAENLRSNF